MYPLTYEADPGSTPCAEELVEGSRKPRRVRVSSRYPVSPPVLFIEIGGREKRAVVLQEKGRKRAVGKFKKTTRGRGVT